MTLDNFQDGSPFSAEGLDSVVNAINHEAILSGGVPSVGTGNFEVDLTACDYVIDGSDYSISADTVTLSSPSASDRVDLITADTTPGFNVVEGTPATNPNADDIPDNEALICAVFVDSGAASLTNSDINEYRVVLTRDATTYKGNDIDTDGNGKPDNAELADNATNLGGVAASEYNTFDVTTQSDTVDSQSSTNVDLSVSISSLISIAIRPDDSGLEAGFGGLGAIYIAGVTNNSGNVRVRVVDNNNDGTHNFTVVALHT